MPNALRNGFRVIPSSLTAPVEPFVVYKTLRESLESGAYPTNTTSQWKLEMASLAIFCKSSTYFPPLNYVSADTVLYSVRYGLLYPTGQSAHRNKKRIKQKYDISISPLRIGKRGKLLVYTYRRRHTICAIPPRRLGIRLVDKYALWVAILATHVGPIELGRNRFPNITVLNWGGGGCARASVRINILDLRSLAWEPGFIFQCRRTIHPRIVGKVSKNGWRGMRLLFLLLEDSGAGWQIARLGKFRQIAPNPPTFRTCSTFRKLGKPENILNLLTLPMFQTLPI